MALITREFTRDELEELDFFDSPVHEEYAGRSRWGIFYDTVFKDENGDHWQITWEDGATENQDYNSFTESYGDENHTAYRVELRSVTKEEWVTVDA